MVSLLAWTVSAAPAPAVRRIQVEPSEVLLEGKWASQQLAVTAWLSDNTTRDLTPLARFKSANAQIAAVGESGIVTPVSDGATTISVTAPGVKPVRVRVTVKDSATGSASFMNDVRPLLSTLGCNSGACHGSQRGKGGLKLSLFGGDPEADFDALTRDAAGRRINRVEPTESLLLWKISGSLAHQGGQKLRQGSPEREKLVNWLERGAPLRDPDEPRIGSLKICPERCVLRSGGSRQLLVTAVFSDGRRRDVTRDATYWSSRPEVARVNGGRVEAAAYGEAAVVAAYLRLSAVAQITVPQPLPQRFPTIQAQNKIDELVLAKLKKLGIPPSEVSSDEEFLRRVYLDVIGLLPTVEEARAFLKDKDPKKRGKLIDRLLERDEFADFWALKWSDLLRIKSEYPVRLWPKAVAVYYRWVRESIIRNKPYDRFVRELLTSNGSNFRCGPANFLRANASKDPQSLGETTALIFMGTRMGCARCHAHPVESWTLEDNLGLAAFFAKVKFKSTLEWKEEIVYTDPSGMLRHPKTREAVKPRFLGGETAQLAGEHDPRDVLAGWLTSPQNPWFAKNIVNRIWYWLMGVGIVHEPDDLRPTNPPENPELLDYLAGELIRHNFDLKHIYRLILNSRTYQLSSTPNRWNAHDTRHFSHYRAKRLTAEQMLDAISQVTEISEQFSSRIPEPYSFWPAGFRAAQLSDGNTECSFLDLFGRPPRDTPYEGERNSETSLRQALYLINSEQLAGKIEASPRVKRLAQPGRSDEEVIEEIWLSAFSRFPTAAEKRTLLDSMLKKNSRTQAIQDLIWAALNAKEFLFNH